MSEKQIIFILDDNYVYPLIVNLGSIRQNSDLPFTIKLVNILNWQERNLLSEENVALIYSICDVLNLKIQIINLKIPISIAKLELEGYGHISPSAWAKVFAFFLVPAEKDKKIVYLDPDTLALENFEKIFDLELGKFPVSARPTPGHEAFEKKWINIYESQTGKKIKTKPPFYFNSGVMYFNLKAFQDELFWIDWKDLVSNISKYDLRIVDQDLLNAVLMNRNAKLPTAYNCYPRELDKASTKIIHYAGGLKPWNFRRRITWFRLDRNSRLAMRMWFRSEKKTLNLLKSKMSKRELIQIEILRKHNSKNLAFAVGIILGNLQKQKLIRNLRELFRRGM